MRFTDTSSSRIMFETTWPEISHCYDMLIHRNLAWTGISGDYLITERLQFTRASELVKMFRAGF